jgi:hypothetical protein
MEVNDQSYTPAALPPRKETPVPIVHEAWWAVEPVWKFGRRENFLTTNDTRSQLYVGIKLLRKYNVYIFKLLNVYHLRKLWLKGRK